MTLDATAREANVRDSIKKFFVDGLKRAQGIEVTFDRTLSTPNIQGTDVDKWVSINLGDMIFDNVASLQLDIYCCTRKDAEGFKLAQLRDNVIQLVQENTMVLYRSHPTNAWEAIGGFYVQEIHESSSMIYEDNTKFKTVTLLLRWGVKI